MQERARVFAVSGICCAAEESTLRKSLDRSLGKDTYAFSLATGELKIDRDGISDERVAACVRKAGFHAEKAGAPAVAERGWRNHADALFAGGATSLVLSAAAAERIGAGVSVVHGILALAIALGGWKVFLKGFRAARAGSLDMNVLMSVAVAGAIAIGKWYEGAAVIVLFALSLMLESYSNARTQRAVSSLLKLSPEQAGVLRNGKVTTVPSSVVTPGETIVIKPGEAIPLDGVVTEGVSDVNEAAITGESLPKEIRPGAQVYAGTLNGVGSLRVRVLKGHRDTTLARVIHLVEEAREQRAPVQHLVDRFARLYTPVVLVIAVAVAAVPPLVLHEPFGVWLYRSLVLLVIACPCALVISTPVTVVSGLAGAARRGMLIKGGKHLETLSRLRAIAFDKTGTLTEGRPVLTDLLVLNSHSEERLLALVAAMEMRSEHPLAAAVLAEADRRSLSVETIEVRDFEALPGLGVRATIDGSTYFLGNHRLCEERGYCSSRVEEALERLNGEGKTAVVLGKETEPLCILAVRDEPRRQSREAIGALRRLGIGHMELLSGDHEAIVGDVAGTLGLEWNEAALMPEAKVAAVRDLVRRHGTVAMVGDGVNDAPALAAASVGIAMGGAGSDVALESADVVLMADDLSRLPVLVRLSRRVMQLVRQNVALAIALKVVFLVLSVSGVATLWMAVLADDGAALAVILNGLRVLTFKEDT